MRGDEPAFPSENTGDCLNVGPRGLTKRELMATVILAGMGASNNHHVDIAVERTDALLAWLNKEKAP